MRLGKRQRRLLKKIKMAVTKTSYEYIKNKYYEKEGYIPFTKETFKD